MLGSKMGDIFTYVHMFVLEEGHDIEHRMCSIRVVLRIVRSAKSQHVLLDFSVWGVFGHLEFNQTLHLNFMVAGA